MKKLVLMILMISSFSAVAEKNKLIKVKLGEKDNLTCCETGCVDSSGAYYKVNESGQIFAPDGKDTGKSIKN